MRLTQVASYPRPQTTGVLVQLRHQVLRRFPHVPFSHWWLRIAQGGSLLLIVAVPGEEDRIFYVEWAIGKYQTRGPLELEG